jgi:hypothetical protein
MKNKKAWLRIIEAFLAILIVTAGVLFVLSKQEYKTDLYSKVHDKQREVLEIISKDDSLRNKILGYKTGMIGSEDKINNNNLIQEINQTIQKMIPINWHFTTAICEPTAICNADKTPKDRDVYVSEVLITSNLEIYRPKKLKFFVWTQK